MVTCGIATITGREKQFKILQDLVSQQVDVIVWQKDSPMGDAAKFKGSQEYDGYYFALDDDLIIPVDYFKAMIAKLQEYDNKIIVTCHGKIFHHFPINSYYRDYQMKYRCLDKVEYDTFVQIGGSGVCAFHTDYFRPDLANFTNGFMADIFLSAEAQRQQIPILVMAHEAGWIQQQPTGEGIYEKYKNNDKVQTDFINSINWVIYEAEKA